MLPGRLPTFEPEPDRDGNPYQWIVRESGLVRARHNNDAQCIRLERALHERHQNLRAVIESAKRAADEFCGVPSEVQKP